MSLEASLKRQLKEVQTLKKKLNKLFAKISPKQQEFFNKIYPKGVEAMCLSTLKTSVSQCERTISKNKETLKETKKLARQFKEEVEVEFGDIKELAVDQCSDVVKFVEERKEAKKQQEVLDARVDITKGLPQTPVTEQIKEFKSLANQEEAKDYFMDTGYELFKLGQGIYYTEAYTYCYINNVFFEVTITAEVLGKKMDVGDKFYWAEQIEDVQFTFKDAVEYSNEQAEAKQQLIEQKRRELEALENS